MKADGRHDVGHVKVAKHLSNVATAIAEKEFEIIKEVAGTYCAILNICGEQFLGAYVNSGAELNVTGKAQAKAYDREYGSSMVERENQRMFKFGDGHHRGNGRLNICKPVSRAYYCRMLAEIIDAEVLLLLGLDALSDMKAVLVFDADRLIST